MTGTVPLSLRIAAIAAAATLIAACGNEGPKAPPAKPPVDVTVLTVKASDTPVGFDYVGQTQSSREVEIRARVRSTNFVLSGRPSQNPVRYRMSTP